MADLSFLFQQTQPQGMMAGYEKGLQDQYKQQELGNASAYADQARFQTERGKALLPYDIEEAQYKQGRGRDISESKDLIGMQKQGIDIQKALNDLDDATFLQGVKRGLAANKGWMTAAYQLYQSGAQTPQVIQEVMKMLPPDKAQELMPQLQKYSTYPPQKAMQELLKGIDAIQLQEAKSDPAYWRQLISSQYGLSASRASTPKPLTVDQALVQAAQSLFPNDPAAQQKYISDRRLERAPAAMGIDKSKEFLVRGSDGKVYPLGATPAGVKEVGVPFAKEEMNKNAFEAPAQQNKPTQGGWGATRVK